jgi:hypothetical protein
MHQGRQRALRRDEQPGRLYEFHTPRSGTSPGRRRTSMRSKTTLAQVVDFHDGGANQRHGKSIHVRPLRLDTNERAHSSRSAVVGLRRDDAVPTGIASAADAVTNRARHVFKYRPGRSPCRRRARNTATPRRDVELDDVLVADAFEVLNGGAEAVVRQR